MSMARSSNLPALLWVALSGLERAHVDLGAGIQGMPSLKEWSNLLRVLDDDGIDRTELPRLLRLSTRATRTEIGVVARKGWAREISAARGRATVQLTARGSEVAARWDPVRASAEIQWQHSIGAGAGTIALLRAALESLVALLPLEHPHYPAGYGAADARITGGHGQDWKAVPREAGDGVSALPLSALVSQSLVAFAMAYEEMSGVALSLTATVIRRVPPEGRSATALGSRAGLSALERHCLVRSSNDENGTIVRLTAKGREIASAYDEAVHGVEQQWRDAFGDTRVTNLRRALEDVHRPESAR
jgi:hypothetical protein